MSEVIEWVRPTGSTITTNSEKATIEGALSKGWRRVGDDLGKIGSLVYYQNLLAKMNKKSIFVYIRNLCGFELNNKPNVENVRKNALAAVKEHLNNG